MLPPTVKARVSVEAGVAQGWRDLVGDAGRIVSHRALRRLAPTTHALFREFGLTAEAVAAAAEDSIAASPADRQHDRRPTSPTADRSNPGGTDD